MPSVARHVNSQANVPSGITTFVLNRVNRSSVTCAVRQMFHDDQINEKEMGRIYGTHERPREMRTGFQAGNIFCKVVHVPTYQLTRIFKY
jgi:hypothetical protein